MAEIKPRIDFEGRTRMETVMPLSSPYLIFLDPSDKCNAHCMHCPTGSREALKYKTPMLMPLDLCKKIIDDLCAMDNPIKTLRLYKMGESLLNPDLHKMVKYAKDSGRFGQVDLTTNGILLTPKLGRKLIDAGLDKIFISVPTSYDIEYRDPILNFIAHRGACKVYVKIIGDDMTQLEKELFLHDFEDADRVFIENLAPCWPEFDVGEVGNVGIYGQPLTPAPKVCPYPFYSLTINSDGTVSACYIDWKCDLILGDLRTETFKSVWNGDKLKRFQIMMLRGERHSHPFCGNCQQLVYGAPDILDPYADELLKKYLDKLP